MAGIEQAAKWIQQGKLVKRWIWGSETTMWLNMDQVTIMVGTRGERDYHPYELPLVDLLAQDWEIVQPSR